MKGSSFEATEKTPFIKASARNCSESSPSQSKPQGFREKESPSTTGNSHNDCKEIKIQRIQQFKWFGYVFILCLLGTGTMVLLTRASAFSKEDVCSFDPIESLRKGASIENVSQGVVASDHEVCSKVGLSILSDGGNAIDAAVSVVLCLGVANPASSGLGGGAFMLIQGDKKNFENRTRHMDMPQFYDARNAPPLESRGKILEVIDCRETAPAASTQDMFLDMPSSASSLGGLAIAVPGELRGLELAHARHVCLFLWSSVSV